MFVGSSVAEKKKVLEKFPTFVRWPVAGVAGKLGRMDGRMDYLDQFESFFVIQLGDKVKTIE